MFLARYLNSRSEHEQAMVQAAQAEAIDGLSPEQRARVASVSSQLLLHPPRLEQAEATAFRARDMAGDDPITLGAAAYTLATVALQRGRYSEALDWAAQPRLVVRDDHPERRMSMGFQHLREMTQMLTSQALLRLDRVDEADRALTTVRQAVRSQGFGGLAASGQALMVEQRFAVGEWDDAVTEFDSLMDLCAELGRAHYAVELAAGARALVALHRGDHHTAGATIAVAEQVEGRGPYNGQLVVLAQALLAECGGSPGEALEILATTWDAAVAKGVVSVCLSLGPDLVRLARAQGDLDRALATSHQIDLLEAANPGVAGIAAAALRCRGLAGDDAALLVQAAAALRGGPRPLESALACENAAEALARSGDRPATRPLFDEAIEAYARLGATWDVARAGAVMRALGIRRGSRGTRVRATSGWDALTRGERAVVELVAEGLTNVEVAERLFLSRHTVKRHLANVMLKLALTSRKELAREATRLGV
jgi:DNA-binding CsgD family transcriptional regulator